MAANVVRPIENHEIGVKDIISQVSKVNPVRRQ